MSASTENNNIVKKKKTSWWKVINEKFKLNFNKNDHINCEIDEEEELSSTKKSITLFDEGYYFYIDETNNGLKINLKYPHLITLVDNKKSDKTLIKIFPLKHGVTTVGYSSLNDIVLKSQDIKDNHCNINYDEVNDNIILNPFGGLCSIDSVLIDKPYQLKLGRNCTNIL